MTSLWHGSILRHRWCFAALLAYTANMSLAFVILRAFVWLGLVLCSVLFAFCVIIDQVYSSRRSVRIVVIAIKTTYFIVSICC